MYLIIPVSGSPTVLEDYNLGLSYKQGLCIAQKTDVIRVLEALCRTLLFLFNFFLLHIILRFLVCLLQCEEEEDERRDGGREKERKKSDF